VFTDEYEEQSRFGWFLLISVVLHALFIWLWPQMEGSLYGIGWFGPADGGLVEFVFVPGQSAIQAPPAPTPAAPVQPRPPRQQQAPQPAEPQAAVAVRTEQQQVQPAAPPAPAVAAEPRPAPQPEPRPAPQPEPAPAPRPEPEPAPAPAPQPEAEPEPGVAEDILVSEQGTFEVAAALEPEPAPKPEPEPEPVPEPAPEVARQPEPEAAADVAPGAGDGAPGAAQPGDEVVQGAPEGTVDGQGTQPGGPAGVSFATRFGFGRPKAVEDTPLDVRLSDVQVEIYVRADGSVERVVLLASSGRDMVDEALVGLMERWSFEATGSPYVEVWRVTFTTGSQEGQTVWQPQPQFVERR